MWLLAASTGWQTALAVAGLVLAAPTSVVAAATFKRTAHVADVASMTAAQEVGLSYMKESLAAQQQTIVSQQGQIGRLEGKLETCETERHALAEQIAELRREITSE